MFELENYRELAKQKERLDYNKELKLIPKCETTIGGFSLYLANDISDIEEQAKADPTLKPMVDALKKRYQ